MKKIMFKLCCFILIFIQITALCGCKKTNGNTVTSVIEETIYVNQNPSSNTASDKDTSNEGKDDKTVSENFEYKPSTSKDNSTASSDKGEEATLTIKRPENHSMISLASDTIEALTKYYKIGDSEAFYGQGDTYIPKSVKLEWELNKKASSYTVELSVNSDMTSAEKLTTKDTYITLTNLFVATKYYWRVTAKLSDGKKIASGVYNFTTEATPRAIFILGVSNTRDIGGYMTESGKRVKQGMVYRAGYLDMIVPEGIDTAIKEYGIRTDLDLRRSGEGTAGTRSPLGTGVKYMNIQGAQYINSSYGINLLVGQEMLLKELKVFADKKNYPIIVHCSVGRDRTGTICFLLNALLGVSKDDLFLDYELTFLSERGCVDKAPAANMIKTFTTLYDYIANYKKGGTLSQNTEQFMLDIGLTADEISAIKSNLL